MRNTNFDKHLISGTCVWRDGSYTQETYVDTFKERKNEIKNEFNLRIENYKIKFPKIFNSIDYSNDIFTTLPNELVCNILDKANLENEKIVSKFLFIQKLYLADMQWSKQGIENTFEKIEDRYTNKIVGFGNIDDYIKSYQAGMVSFIQGEFVLHKLQEFQKKLIRHAVFNPEDEERSFSIYQKAQMLIDNDKKEIAKITCNSQAISA